MPRIIGREHFNPSATRALRHTPGKGTIPCVLDGLPAAGKGLDGKYYCMFHLRKLYGFVPGVS